MKASALQLPLAFAIGFSALGTQAALLQVGDQLTINTGVVAYDIYGNAINVTSGSWFGADINVDGQVSGTERVAMRQGTEGIIIGIVQALGTPTHNNAPYPTDWNRIDVPVVYFGNTGEHFTVSPITGSTTSGLDFSGWRASWNGLPQPVNMGGGAWGTGFSNGIADFIWDGTYGDSYTLDYHATIPAGDPTGFGNVKFAYHLEGTVQAVPIPSAVWLFGSGLLGLLGKVRRCRTT